MMELHPIQAKVLEWLREGQPLDRIACIMGYKEERFIWSYIMRLEEMRLLRVINRSKAEFQFLIGPDDYTVGYKNVAENSIKAIEERLRMIESRDINDPHLAPFEEQDEYKKKLAKEQKIMIYENYGKVPRSKLAEMTGLERFDLNMALIQMGLGR